MAKNKAKRNKQPDSLSKLERSQRNLYAFERGVTVLAPAEVVITNNANGTRTFLMPAKTAPAPVQPEFNAFALLNSVLAQAQHVADHKIMLQKNRPLISKTEELPANPASYEHVALVTNYLCKCGTNTRLFTNYARKVPGTMYQDGVARTQGVTYTPANWAVEDTIVAVEQCVNCLNIDKSLVNSDHTYKKEVL